MNPYLLMQQAQYLQQERQHEAHIQRLVQSPQTPPQPQNAPVRPTSTPIHPTLVRD